MSYWRRNDKIRASPLDRGAASPESARLMHRNEITHLHFIGICGTAMGAVAAALRERGFTVTGSDENVYPPMSTFLEEKGVAIFSGYRAENIPPAADLIVIGNAMKRGNPEVEAVLNRKLYYLSLPETLKEFFLRGRHNLVVTGTHGKTTTTSLLAWILECAGLEPGYLIGGIPKNLGQGGVPPGFEIFRDRGRRIRHGVFRQALEVRPLHAGTGDREQHRVRSRGHFQQHRGDQAVASGGCSTSCRATGWCC